MKNSEEPEHHHEDQIDQRRSCDPALDPQQILISIYTQITLRPRPADLETD